MERLKFIIDEIINKGKEQQSTRIEQEINFLVKTKEEVENSLNKEKHEVNQMANRMYEVWKNINEVRKDKAYISSSVELKVHNHTDSYGETD